MVTDIESIKEIGELEAKLRAIVETAVDGIVTIDTRGVVESFNPAAESMFGYTAAEAIGQNVSRLMPDSYGRHHDRYFRSWLTSPVLRVVVEFAL